MYELYKLTKYLELKSDEWMNEWMDEGGVYSIIKNPLLLE